MILTEIYAPALDERDDYALDENVPVNRIIEGLAEILCKKTKSTMPESFGDFMLCSMDEERVLDRRKTLYENGIRDGSRLLFV